MTNETTTTTTEGTTMTTTTEPTVEAVAAVEPTVTEAAKPVSKAARARAIYAIDGNSAKPIKEFAAILEAELGLSKQVALTYAYNCRDNAVLNRVMGRKAA